jgi:hypothetical protein
MSESVCQIYVVDDRLVAQINTKLRSYLSYISARI